MLVRESSVWMFSFDREGEGRESYDCHVTTPVTDVRRYLTRGRGTPEVRKYRKRVIQSQDEGAFFLLLLSITIIISGASQYRLHFVEVNTRFKRRLTYRRPFLLRPIILLLRRVVFFIGGPRRDIRRRNPDEPNGIVPPCVDDSEGPGPEHDPLRFLLATSKNVDVVPGRTQRTKETRQPKSTQGNLWNK